MAIAGNLCFFRSRRASARRVFDSGAVLQRASARRVFDSGAVLQRAEARWLRKIYHFIRFYPCNPCQRLVGIGCLDLQGQKIGVLRFVGLASLLLPGAGFWEVVPCRE